jgi:GntR family transcriptional regulator / MocR family aminotransferase
VRRTRAEEDSAVEAARQRGVGWYGMSRHRTSGSTRPAQLVLDFGNLTDRAICAGLHDVADLL